MFLDIKLVDAFLDTTPKTLEFFAVFQKQNGDIREMLCIREFRQDYRSGIVEVNEMPSGKVKSFRKDRIVALISKDLKVIGSHKNWEEPVWLDPKCGCRRSPDISYFTPCPECSHAHNL